MKMKITLTIAMATEVDWSDNNNHDADNAADADNGSNRDCDD